MTARRPAAHRWSVLDESADPVPGDPEEVARLGRELRRTAEAIDKEAREIKALASVENWKGKTATEFRGSAEGAGDKLRKAFKRYDEAADALGTRVVDGVCGTEYASELHRAQQMADQALQDAEAAQGEGAAARRSLDGQPDDTPKDDPDTRKYEKQKEQAATALEGAKKALGTAKAIRDAAEKRAADAIHDVIEGDGLKDGWRDKFKNWVHENAGWLRQISAWSGRIALWAGVAALALGWIPVIGQAIAAVANVIALAASVVALATDLVLALGGEGSWKSVFLDAVGVATFGLGRAAMAGAKGAAAGTKALARSSLAKKALASGMKPNKAWNLANRGAQGSVRGKGAAEAMANMPRGKLPSWSNLKEGFSPTAMTRDTVDGVKSVRNAFSGQGWRDGLRGMAPPRSAGTLDPDLARTAADLRGIAPEAAGMPNVSGALNNFTGQTNVWTGATLTGVAAGTEGVYGPVTSLVDWTTG
ncbi:putative T7SS-secreted protein [Streptomyces sp. NPDC002564]|uniref:putative T7SS-secreted protein n=1 Tax=Streptomyces sp. NPDC002564 TaxID=3364649 RepID=UPI0036A1EBE9